MTCVEFGSAPKERNYGEDGVNTDLYAIGYAVCLCDGCFCSEFSGIWDVDGNVLPCIRPRQPSAVKPEPPIIPMMERV